MDTPWPAPAQRLGTHERFGMRCRPMVVAFSLPALLLAVSAHAAERTVPREHPRLFGSRDDLKKLAQERREAYERVKAVAKRDGVDEHPRLISLALVAAIEQDAASGRQAHEMAMRHVHGPIKKGHIRFGADLAWCAVAYDLCHPWWPEADRRKFHRYMNATVDANVKSETHVFHNGWYGYKNWGIGLACLATYHENSRAPEILDALDRDYDTRAAPALELAGDGGGWAEGYYVHYWLYEWLFFCEAARRCTGADYFAAAPGFYRHRAVASLFETYPGIGLYRSRRAVPMGDGGGRVFGGDRDKQLSARRILAGRFRDEPGHRIVHAFNEITPRSAAGNNAYKDFLWRDPSVKKGELNSFKLSHYSPGAGHVHARSSWDEGATYFFFKCSDRFTAHQHLDAGHFLIYKHEELLGDGGHYDGFGTPHDVNYHLRTIAHNTVLVHDPDETWPAIRAGKVTGNDGGQHHAWPHHNGAVGDPQQWKRDKKLYDIADVTAFEDHGDWLYVAGDCTRAYSPRKMECFTRQIVYLRPDTFVVFDRVTSKKPGFRKTWLLQAMEVPAGRAPSLVVTNGRGRLFIQTLLPEKPQVRLCSGDDLYTYGGRSYRPSRDTGPAPKCRIEISPPSPAREDVFLHVLTAADADTDAAATASCSLNGEEVVVAVDKAKVAFRKDRAAGWIEVRGERSGLAE